MAFAHALPLRSSPSPRRVAALSRQRGVGGAPAAPAPTPPGAAPGVTPHGGGGGGRGGGGGVTAAGPGRRRLPPPRMAAPRFDGADFGDAALTGGSLPAARRGVAGDADGAGHAQRVQLVRILLRLINLPRQNLKVRALIEALEAAPAVPLPAVAAATVAAAGTAAPPPPPPQSSTLPPLSPPPGHTEATASRRGGIPTGGPLRSPPPAITPPSTPPLSPAEAALHAALDGGRPWRLLFSSTTLGTPSSVVRLRRVGTRFYVQPRLAVNFAEWSILAAGGVEYTGLFLILSRYAVVSTASASGRPAVLRLTFLEHQLRPIGGRPSSPGRPASRVPPRPDRLVAALTRMLPAEFFAPPERVDISHLAAGGKTPLLVTRSKGRRFAGVANVWARDAATAAAEGGVIDKTTALMDRAVARVTGWLPPAGPAGGTVTSGR